MWEILDVGTETTWNKAAHVGTETTWDKAAHVGNNSCVVSTLHISDLVHYHVGKGTKHMVFAYSTWISEVSGMV